MKAFEVDGNIASSITSSVYDVRTHRLYLTGEFKTLRGFFFESSLDYRDITSHQHLSSLAFHFLCRNAELRDDGLSTSLNCDSMSLDVLPDEM